MRRALEHRFVLPAFIQPANIECLKTIPLVELARTPIEWPLDENEVAVSDIESKVEMESQVGQVLSFRDTPYYHIDRLLDEHDNANSKFARAAVEDRIRLMTFTTSTGTEFAACNLVLRRKLVSDLGWTTFNGFASEIEQLNQMFGRNWLDLLVKEPISRDVATRKLDLKKLITVEDYETSQLPDFHIAKGSMTRSLHRTALRRPHDPLIRNFRRLYSIIARS